MPSNLEINIKTKDESSRALKEIHQSATGLGGALGQVSKIAGGFIVADGIKALGGFLIDSAKAAAEDAASLARLQTAVANTGVSYQDYSKQIEGVIKAGQNLGFTDDQTRDSLSLLAAQTSNTEEAIKRYALAQDLARGANIDVVTASRLLGKVTEENVNVLARYGIKVEKGASETELFSAVFQKFHGQAQTFSDSTAGKMARLQDKISELKEALGAQLLPAMTQVVDASIQMVDAINKISGALTKAQVEAKSWSDSIMSGLERAIPGLRQFNSFFGASPVVDYQTRLKQLGETELPDVAKKTEAASVSTKKLADAEADAKRATGDFGQKVKDLSSGLDTLTGKLKAGFDELEKWKNVPTQEQLNISMAIAQEEAAIARLNLSLIDGTAKKQGNAAATQGQIDKLQASLDLHNAQKDALDKVRDAQIETTKAIDAGSGKLGAIIGMESEWAKEIGNANRELLATDPAVNTGVAAIGRLESKLAAAQAKAYDATAALKDFNTALANSGGGGEINGISADMFNAPGRAVGGGVERGKPYWVGERGTELFVPDQNGSIIPHMADGSLSFSFSNQWRDLIDNLAYTAGQKQALRSDFDRGNLGLGFRRELEQVAKSAGSTYNNQKSVTVNVRSMNINGGRGRRNDLDMALASWA